MQKKDVPETRFSLARLLGTVLSACGLLADVVVGLAILHGVSPWLLLLHPPAVLIWVGGICTINNQRVWGEFHAMLANIRRWRGMVRTDVAGDADERHSWNARHLVMALLGLALFPGFGPVGCTAAYGLAALPFMVRRQRAAPVMDTGANPAPVLIDGLANPLLDLAIQPLIDVVNAPDAQGKRNAIRLLGQQFDHEAVHLLRALLTDPDPDVRSEASVTLFRFEDLITRAVNEGTTDVQNEPTAEHYAVLAAAYCHAVNLGLLDRLSAQYYLSQACDAYTRAAAIAPAQTEYWVALARVHRDRGDSDAALLALDTALALDPGDVPTNLLRMEIAFAERRWDIVAASSVPTSDDAVSMSATRDLFHWWSGSPSSEEIPMLIRVNADGLGHMQTGGDA